MGLCVLPKLEDIINSRKRVFDQYDILLNFDSIRTPLFEKNLHYNYSYYPIIFQSEEILLEVRKALLANEISTRRYFYPSLNKLPFLGKTQTCDVSENISKRVLCLPVFTDLSKKDIERICDIINPLIQK